MLHQVGSEADLVNDAIIVKLNGLIHHDDKIALKSITAQVIFYYFKYSCLYLLLRYT